jgi:hypothetical protein
MATGGGPPVRRRRSAAGEVGRVVDRGRVGGPEDLVEALRRDDLRLDGRPHLGEDVDLHEVGAERLDRLLQADLPPVDADLACAPDLVGEIADVIEP